MIDCRSEDGLTIGLIDAIITCLELLKDRDLSSHDIQEALKDLQSNTVLLAVLAP